MIALKVTSSIPPPCVQADLRMAEEALKAARLENTELHQAVQQSNTVRAELQETLPGLADEVREQHTLECASLQSSECLAARKAHSGRLPVGVRRR